MSELAGFNTGLGNLCHLPKLQSRSISPENFSGEKGHAGMATDGMGAQAARDLGPGWKISPCVAIKPDQVITLADIDGPGVIQSMWNTGSCAVKQGRLTILRIYWDRQDQPSVECPLGDFFATGWGSYAQVSSLPVAVNPSQGFNCFWPMPFRGHCRIALQNLSVEETVVFYQINYALTDVLATAAVSSGDLALIVAAALLPQRPHQCFFRLRARSQLRKVADACAASSGTCRSVIANTHDYVSHGKPMVSVNAV